MPYIAELLKKEREKAGLTIAEAAKACGVQWSHWWRWERGEHAPRDLDRILKAIGNAK